MKQYSLDVDPRKGIVVVAGTGSTIVLVYLQVYVQPAITALLPAFIPQAVMGVAVGLSFVTLFSLLYLFIEKYFWRSLVGGWIIRIPNFTGVWEGTLERRDHAADVAEASIPIRLEIAQTLSGIEIILTNLSAESLSGRTRSAATAVHISTRNPIGHSIEHIFRFEGGWGASSLLLKKSGKERLLEGPFVSSVPRTGFIHVRRVRKSTT